MVIRTQFFDEVLEGKFLKTEILPKQIVILASGMDTRYLRLNLASGISARYCCAMFLSH
jgi:O-methyltransferase involved in polyketide biosynthesis